MLAEQFIKAIPKELWAQAVYQTYINSLLSWIGLILFAFFFVVLWFCWKGSDNWDGDVWPIPVLAVAGIAGFVGFLIWIGSGFNFLNPEYHTYGKVLRSIAGLF